MAMSVARAPAAAILAGLLVLTVGSVAVAIQPASQRGLATGVFLLAVLAGLVLAGRLPGGRERTVMERINDLAFGTVLVAASLIASLALRPWLVALPGLVSGVLAGRSLRAPGRPGPTDRGEAP
jgi:hypothetical protein